MKEMVGGCCVCSDERGWPDNPLVYCDGNGCTVAVHQACYGIVTVPTGPWYCRKCESPERQARVRCELCPSKAGALKRADTGGWAHVVCALYIPEVRFGNVTSMEPIILQLIPAERFNKTCYICQDMGKISRATAGACMQCNKSGCKQQFHVTCAQGLGLLCEEAGNYLDNVKYCGYCQHHYSKLKKGGNVKTIPPYKPISHDSHSSDSSPEKEVEGTPTGTSAANTTPTTTTTSSKGGNTKTSANRKSGHQNSSATSKTAQSSSKAQTTTSQASFATSNSVVHSTPSTTNSSTSGTSSSSKHSGHSKSSHSHKSSANKSHHSNEKSSSNVKKASSPGEGQRRSSQHQDTSTTASRSASPASSTKATTPTTTSGSVTPQSQPQPTETTANSSVSKGGLSQASASKGAIQQTPGQQANAPKPPVPQEPPTTASTNASTPTNTAASTIVSPPTIQQPQQVSLPPPPVPPPKFTPNTFAESVITNNDNAPSYVASDTKQTKKRKAASQINNSALKATSEYAPTTHASSTATQQANDNNTYSTNKWDSSTHPVPDQPIDASKTDKVKKAKTDISQPSVTMHGPLQTPPANMHVDLSTSSHYQPSLPPPSMPIAGTSTSSPLERGAGGHSATVSSIIHPSLSGPSTSGTSTSHAHLQVGKYGIPTSGVGESSRGEMPNSLLVSVPLPSASQGLNLTSQHQMSEQTSTVVSSHSPLGNSSVGRTTSWGGLQVAYEMQPTQHQHMSQAIVDQSLNPVEGKRSSDKVAGISNSMGVPPARNKKRAALNATVVSGSVATSTIQSTGMHQLPGPPPPPPPPPPPLPVKRTSGPPLPSQQHIYQETGIKDSPPSSPTPDSNRATKPGKADKLSRGAPHMLGNEINPGSAAAARLSEQLSAELAAHSVATAAANQSASTLVPPPLLNKATSASKSGGTIIMGSGGAQSLDQLLERQWEQGSQFLMEQAQHFDIASLLSCLHQLRTENVRLEEHVGSLLQRRDHLLAVNARLAIPLNTANIPAEPARLPSQNGSQVRPPSTTVRTETPVSDRSHQLVIRDMQPKPS